MALNLNVDGQIAGDFQTRSTTGNWSNFNSWNVRNAGNTAWIAAVSGQLPNSTTDVFIQAGHTVSVDNAAAICKSINASAALTARIAFSTATSVLSVNGDLILVAGGHNLFGTWTAGAKFVFVGSANQTTTNLTGSTTFVNLEVNKIGSSISTDGNLRFSTLLNIVSGTLVTGTAQDIQGTSNTSNITIQSSGTITQTGGAGVIRVGSSGSSPIGNVIVNGTLNINTTTGISAVNVASLSIEDNGATGGVVNVNFTSAGAVITATAGGVTIRNNAALNIASTCRTTWIAASTNLTLQSGGFLNISNSSFVLPTSYSFLGTVSYNNGSQTIAAATSYTDLTLSSVSAPANKTFTTGQNVNGNLLISGNAVLLGGTNLINIGGNWTNYATGGFTEGTSTVNFNGTGAQSINTTGGEDFYLVRKSGAGTLTLNSNVATGGGGTSGLNISAGILDAGTFTLSGTGGTTLTMTGGTLRLGKLNTTLPEFTGTYALSSGTVELNGAGTQSFKGGENYANITFSNSGIKTLAGSINPPTNNITGTITIANTAIFDATNLTMGGPGTNITMTGNSTYRTAGTGTKPDAQGTYTLGTGTTIEFSNVVATPQEIRLAPSYYNIVVSGSSVANSSLTSTPLNIQSGGSFNVTSTGVFKHANVNGFSGAANTAVSNTNNPTIVLASGSTIDYYRADGTAQIISNQIPYHHLTFSGSGSKNAPSTTLTVQGNLTKTGTSTFTHNNGLVLLDGTSAQSFAGLDFYGLEMSGSTKTTNGGKPTIDSLLQINLDAVLNISNNDSILLLSTATRTARVAKLDHAAPGNAITYGNANSKFVVQRYIRSGRKWRFLSVPTDNTAQSFKSSWQENAPAGQNDRSGYGVIIGNNSASWNTTGFDVLTPGGPSVKRYDATSNSYLGIPNTTSPIQDLGTHLGFFAFVPGDRSISGGTSTSATTLQSRGKLFVGDQSVIVPGLEIKGVGNPFASPINMITVLDATNPGSGLVAAYQVWDPQSTGIYGLGRFQALAWDPESNNFKVTPGGGSFDTAGSYHNNLESGLAFFVKGNGGGTLHLTEGAKALTATSVSFTSGARQALRGNLYLAPGGVDSKLLDGFYVNFHSNYSNAADGYDIEKIANTGENAGLKTSGKKLIVERRSLVQDNDTLHIELSNLRVQNYTWQFALENMDYPGRTGFLIDRYTNTTTPLSMAGTTTYNFSVANVASSNAADRFIIVFMQPTGGPLPVSITTVSANRKEDKSIDVLWKVENETNISSYEVERSADGLHFNGIHNRMAQANNGGRASYQHNDLQPLAGDNFYRIKANSIGGQVQYSAIVKVSAVKVPVSISVYPNPVEGRDIQLRFAGQQPGRYQVQVSNAAGQVIYKSLITINNSLQTETLNLPTKTAAGSYQLSVSGADGKTTVEQLLLK